MKRYPILRLLLPYMAGLIAGWQADCNLHPYYIFAAGAALYVAMWLTGRGSMSRRYALRPWYVLPIAVVAFGLGWWNMSHRFAHDNAPHNVKATRQVVRVNEIDRSDFGMSIVGETTARELLLLAVRGCDYTLEAGDLIAVDAPVEPIVNRGNPGEIDYAGLMRHRGISREMKLSARDIRHVGRADTWSTRMTRWRDRMSRRVYAGQLSPSAARTVVALTLGQSRQIDPATRTMLSQSGLSHLMALSGLHVGVVALLVWWLLWPLDYMTGRRVRLWVSLAVMTAFVVFVGLPPSVTRAWVMMAVALVPALFHRKTYSLNGLLLAAMFVLVIWPESLFSVGFQFSFITVGALLVVGNRIDRHRLTSHRWLNAIAGTVIVSVIATLATAILSAYYFHTVALSSVLSNLPVIPMFAVFMIACAAHVLLSVAGIGWSWLDTAVDTLHDYVMWVGKTIAGLPGSHLDHVWVDGFVVWCYYGLAIALLLWWWRRDARWLMVALCVAIAATGDIMVSCLRVPPRGLMILNDPKCLPVVYREVRRAWVWVPDDTTYDEQRFAGSYNGLISRYGLDHVEVIKPGNVATRAGDGLVANPLALLMERKILVAGGGIVNDSIPPVSATDSLNVLAVSNRHHKALKGLLPLVKRQGTVVLSGAMNVSQSDSLSRQAAAAGCHVHVLSRQGAWVIE